MFYSRREFGKIAAQAGAVAAIARPAMMYAAGKPDSKFNGVQVGVISYSYRQMPEFTADSVLRYAVENGINAVELENVQESWAGAPKRPMMGRPPGPPAGGAAGPGGAP